MPFSDNTLKIFSLHQTIEVIANALCVTVKELFSCNHTDSLEDFNPQSASRNRANYVDSVLFAFNVVSPSVENVATFVDVNVIFSSADKGFVCHC